MIVLTVVDDGVIIDEIQIEQMVESHNVQPGMFEWRSTRFDDGKPVVRMSGEVRHFASDGAISLVRKVLASRSVIK